MTLTSLVAARAEGRSEKLMPRRPAPLVVTRTADSVLVAWDNRIAAGRRSLLILFVGAMALFSAFAAALVSHEPRWNTAAIAGFALLVDVAFAYSLLSRRWAESVELSCDSFTYLRSGFFAPGPCRYPLGEVAEVAFGYFGTGDDREAIITLNVVRVGGWGFRNRTIVGYWLPPADQRRVFEALRPFARDQGLPLIFTTPGVEAVESPAA